MTFTHFNEKDGLLRFKSTKVESKTLEESQTVFWAAGFSFSKGSLIQECGYKSEFEYVFFGEEQF